MKYLIIGFGLIGMFASYIAGFLFFGNTIFAIANEHFGTALLSFVMSGLSVSMGCYIQEKIG